MARDVSLSPSSPPSPSPWSFDLLPPKIAAAVLCRLPSHVDRVRFAAVCRAWRAAAGRQPRQPLPWLALPDGTFFSYPGSASLRFPDAARYHGSCGDCLLLGGGGGGDGDGYLLVHPFSGDTIMRLPALSSVRFVIRGGDWLAWRSITDDRRAPKDTAVRKVVIYPGKVVAAMVGDGRLDKIAMCRPDSDSWVMSAHDAWRRITDIAFYDGKVYAVKDTGDLFAMPVAVDSHTGDPKVACAKIVIKAAAGVDAPARRRKAPRAMRYLLVSGGRLLMIRREVVTIDTTATIRFTVFQADLVSSRWSEVKGVGDDTALFVGRWTSLSRRVSRYGLPGNRIHFLDDDVFCNGRPGQFGSYDMTDGATYPLLPPLEEVSNGAGDTPATWLFAWEQEGVMSWRDLPTDLCGLILRRLPCREDRFHLSEVCRHWHVCALQHLYQPQPSRPPVVEKPPAPAAAATGVAPPAVAAFAPPAVAAVATPAVAYLALQNGEVFRYPELELTTTPCPVADSAGYICAACDDWLLFEDDDGLFRLSSPLTGKTRLLPSLVDVRAHGAPVEIVNEPAPTTQTRAEWTGNEAMAVRKLVMCPDGFIAAIIGREHFGKVALCSLETFSWSVSAHDRWRWYDDLAFCGGRLYAVTACGDLLAFEVGVDGDTGEPFVARVERVVVGDPTWGLAKLRYLVPSSSGAGTPALLMVVRRQRQSIAELTVFRADLASSRWVDVDRLGRGEALFVGRLCSRSVRARLRAEGGGGGGGVRGDQIFFLPDDCVGMSFWESEQQRRGTSQDHAAVYDMLDGSVTDLLPRELKSRGPTPAAWLFPSSGRDGGE